MSSTLYNLNCLDYLPFCDKYDLIWCDPPDNLGLAYNVYKDNLPNFAYYEWIGQWLTYSLSKADTVVISYYWKHDLEIKALVRNLLRYHFPSFSAKTLIWRFTFGQHNTNDCGSGFRYLLRLNKSYKKVNTDDIRELSTRQLIGDPRADDNGRVPDDVWNLNLTATEIEKDARIRTREDIKLDLNQEPHEILDYSRVTGNSPERRPWHPTQHPESLITRLILMHVPENGRILDLFAGTGTMMRCGVKMGHHVDACEIDNHYCSKISEEDWFVSNKCELKFIPEIKELINNEHLNCVKNSRGAT